MATGRPETIDAASLRTEAQRRMPGGQLSCFARNGGAAARGRKLNAGIAASRARRSRCPARSSHHRDPNGRAARNRNSARRSQRTPPPRDHASATLEIVLAYSRRRPASPKTRGRKERPAIATSVGQSPARAAATSDRRPHTRCKVRPEDTLLPPCSDQNPRRTGRRRTLIRSRRRRTYDSASLPRPLDPSGGDAASRAQAVTPITTAPITAKTCRHGSDVMVRPESPNVA